MRRRGPVTLGEFLRAQAGNAAPWNCSTMPADWCIALGHSDFAEAWRAIVTGDACNAAHAAPGGLVGLWREGIGSTLPHADVPQAGDIAVVHAHGIESGAIFTGGKWAVRGQRCLRLIALDRVRLVEAWRP